MTEEKKPEIESPPVLSKLEKSEISNDAVIGGARKSEHQLMFLDARAEGNQESPSDLSLKALNPEDPQYASLIANRFEIVDNTPKSIKNGELKPLYDYSPLISKDNEVSIDFYRKVVEAWFSLPEIERNELIGAGVIVRCKEVVNGEKGTPAAFFHATKSNGPEIHIGATGTDTQSAVSIFNENRDVSGSLKHEAGHAFFDIFDLAHDTNFSKLFYRDFLKLPKDMKNDPQYKNQSHVFAECYAFVRGRQSDRVNLVKEHFREVRKFVEKKFEK
ncbi:MAG: hypothetical protein KIT34_15530 [Cyanobacteria bacterium TGS_CYA1]|nr:hypothetical protein [Cyanobacteria bacterium TGS_CYA1]